MAGPPDDRDALLELLRFLGPEAGAPDRASLARAIRAAGLPAVLARQGSIDEPARARIEARLDRLLASRDRAPTAAGRDAIETDIYRGGPRTEPDLALSASPSRADASTIDAGPAPSQPGGNGKGNGIANGHPGGGIGREGEAGRDGGGSRRFTVLRPYKSGGLGLVSVARDEELHREVAYKEIREGYAHQPDKRARFVAEAEITGGLEHPGIVPVYALGRDARGRPFYAMKFIRGRTLKDAVAEHRARAGPASSRRVSFRDLIGRMVAVCDALQYAHSRGVIHRDVKPANIMLGRYGETLVVDWGLAKVFDRKGRPRPSAGPSPASATEDTGSSDEVPFELHSETAEGETPPGNSVGTPGYMSPEQARGAGRESDAEEPGPRADVYSLGATLYHVLTGRTSIEDRDRVDFLRRLESGDIRPPRALDPTVPRPLDAICMKAMATEPAGRYASPRALADDLRRWLADEPVSAFRDPPASRVFRWVRRHKPVVAGGLMFLVATIGVLFATLGLIWSEQRRADANLARLGDAAWDSFLEMGQSQIVFVGKFDIARSRLADQADAIFDEYLRQHPDDRRALERSAIIARESAKLHRLFGDNLPRARAQLGKAIGHFERLVVEIPEELRFQEQLILAYTDRVELSLLEERWDDLEDDLERALGLAEAWPSWTYQHAWAFQLRAKYLSLRGRQDEAAAAIDEAIALLGTIGDIPDPPNFGPRKQYLMVVCQSLRAGIAADRDRPGEALEAIAEGLRVLDAIGVRARDDPDAGFCRVCLLYRRATIDAGSPGGGGRAEDGLREAAEISRGFVRSYPDMKAYAILEAQCLMGLAGVRIAAGGRDLEAVASDLARAATILETVEVSRNRTAELVDERGRLDVLLGQLAARLGRPEEARARVAAGAAAIDRAVTLDPMNTTVRKHRDYARAALAEVGPTPPR